MSWADDSAISVGHEDIVAVLEAIGTRSIPDALDSSSASDPGPVSETGAPTPEEIT